MRLFLFVFQLVYLLAFVESKGEDDYWTSRSLSHKRKDDIIKSKPRRNSNVACKAPTGPFCQKIVAYFVGTFQYGHASTPSFDAQFQIRLNADPERKRIIVEADQWNETFSNSSDFELDFYYSDSHQWCSIKEDDCLASFSKNVTEFRLDLNRKDGTFFHLLYFENFNNSFGLYRHNGGCSQYPLDNMNPQYSPDFDYLHVCLCCEKYAPDVRLGCPYDPWKDEPKPTPPAKSTTKAVTPPPVHNLTCDAVTAYYNGIFSNGYIVDQINVEFQMRLKADNASQQIYFTIDQWNEEKIPISSIDVYYFRNDSPNHCFSPINNTQCSVDYTDSPDSYIYSQFDHDSSSGLHNAFNFLEFPSFANRFVLQDAVDQCTKYQPSLDLARYEANTTLFEFCMCCGEYAPHPSLNCPKNPWAKQVSNFRVL